MRKAKAAAAVRPPHKSLMKQVLRHWEFYLLLLPGIIITIIFKYVPIYGVQIAFRDYNPVGGFFGSPWVGLKWFERFFNSYNSVRMIRNTVLLSLYSILWTFPIPIILALLINQVKSKKFQRVTQTIIYAPHFISIMILCGMLRIFLSPYGGLINIIARWERRKPSISLMRHPPSGPYISHPASGRTQAGEPSFIWRLFPAWTLPCMRRRRWTARAPGSGSCTSISRSWCRSS